jgi:AcrR family transcriptional regulator
MHPHRATSRLAPRKKPQQQRAAVTRDAILEAAARILERDGLPALNTNRVADAAGVSVGSLYQYYPNKTALLAALSIRQQAELVDMLERVSRQTENLALAPAVKKLVGVALRQQFGRAKLAAALDYAERQAPLNEALQPQRQLLLATLQSFLARYRQHIGADIKTAALDLLTIVQSLVDGAAERGESNTLALRRRVERAALGYLLFDLPKGS